MAEAVTAACSPGPRDTCSQDLAGTLTLWHRQRTGHRDADPGPPAHTSERARSQERRGSVAVPVLPPVRVLPTSTHSPCLRTARAQRPSGWPSPFPGS